MKGMIRGLKELLGIYISVFKAINYRMKEKLEVFVLIRILVNLNLYDILGLDGVVQENIQDRHIFLLLLRLEDKK